MLPAAVLGALLYVVVFSAVYVWVIVQAPSKYQESAGFRLRTHFLLNKWHPERWFWGILFVARNLICSLIPSMTTDGSVQVLSMFVIMFSYFLASATCNPWRDELSNTHDLIMVGSLLMTLVVSQALQVPSTMGSGWFALLEVASSSVFFAAALICVVMLSQHLAKELILFWEQAKSPSLQDLPNLMTSTEGSKGTADSSDNVEGSKKSRVRMSLSSPEAKINDIYSTLSSLSAWNDDSALLEVVKQLEEELPTSDLRRLQWSMGIIGYHVLGDRSRKPSGIVLPPAASRNLRVAESEVAVEELAEV